nr:hypothetical protein [Myxococcota bacterium]
ALAAPRARRARRHRAPAVIAAAAFDDLRSPLLAAPVDAPRSPPAAAVPPPSELYAAALRAYAASRCEEAIAPLQRVLEGETADSPAHVERAELLLGECLLRLGYVHSAFAVLDGIARRGEDHSQLDQALAPLGRIGERVADPASVVESIGRYREDRLVRLEGTAQHDALLHLMARARYAEADFDAAARLFARVRAGSRWYLPARYWEGVSHVRRRRVRPAAAAFRAVIDASSSDRYGSSGERERHRDLAWMALARVTYSAAAPGRAEADAARQSQLLTSALDAWQRVPFGSEHGLDAFFEESWALYVLGEHARALGHVHGLLAPQLEDRPFPEAYVLRATAYYEHCRYRAAETAIADFHRRYDSLLTSIAHREQAIDDPGAAYAFLDDVRSGRGPGGLEGLVLRSAFQDRELARQMIQVRSIDAELARIGASRAPLAGSTLALRLEQELSILRSLAVGRAGESVRARVRRIGDDLRARANEVDTVQLEIETARRRALQAGAPLTSSPERPVAIVAVQGDQMWPFDGEYWEDELPYYREAITSICAR